MKQVVFILVSMLATSQAFADMTCASQLCSGKVYSSGDYTVNGKFSASTGGLYLQNLRVAQDNLAVKVKSTSLLSKNERKERITLGDSPREVALLGENATYHISNFSMETTRTTVEIKISTALEVPAKLRGKNLNDSLICTTTKYDTDSSTCD